MKHKIAINGFGRIGRMALRNIIERGRDVEVVGINDLSDPEALAHLFAFDSSYGRLSQEVWIEDKKLCVGDMKIPLFSERDPRNLPWKELEAKVVLECTGVFRKREQAAMHREAGAEKVIMSAPAKDEVDATVVMGVNDSVLTGEEQIISCASCTTNCLAPIVQVLDQQWGVERGMMTTVHSYTAGQNLLDGPNKDPRRARSAAQNIVPTTTGAAKAVGLVLPHLQGRLNGEAIRVPTPTGSITILTAILKDEPASVEAVHEAYRAASQGAMKGILAMEDRPLVSRDYYGDPHSCTIDTQSSLQDGNMIKVVGWYDNEWGYACRLVELAEKVS